MISTQNAAKLKSRGKCLIEWLRRRVCQRSIGVGGKDAQLRSYKPNVVTWNTLIDPTLQMKTQKLSGFRWWVFIFLKWYLKSPASHGFCRWRRWRTWGFIRWWSRQNVDLRWRRGKGTVEWVRDFSWGSEMGLGEGKGCMD